MPNVFVPSQIVIQLENQVQTPQWGAPVVISGCNIVTDKLGNPLMQPAFSQRPMAEDEFTEEYLQAINSQLMKLNLKLSRVESSE